MNAISADCAITVAYVEMLNMHCHFSRVANLMLRRGTDVVEFEENKDPFTPKLTFCLFRTRFGR